jgi:hypothetical protein
MGRGIGLGRELLSDFVGIARVQQIGNETLEIAGNLDPYIASTHRPPSIAVAS